MVDQRPQGTGYLRQLTYRVGGVDRLCRGTGANGHQGDGYVQNHTAFGGDSSSHGTPGTTTVELLGAHHVRITYSMPGYTIAGASVPTTVQWLFADGITHPIFALSQDARTTVGNLGADTRSPYGDMHYDGGLNAAVGGASWGDQYKFTTLAANPERVTRASGWRYNEANTIPYAMQWTDPAVVDAEMGHVATLPISVQDQGGDPRTFPLVEIRGLQDIDGPMIDDENWAYQILNYVLPANGFTISKRLTWGSNWGLPGGFNNWGNGALSVRQYSQHATGVPGGTLNGNRADGMLLAYSVFVVLGTHNGDFKNGAVGQMVRQMENAALATLAAATGTVPISGPAGVGNAAGVTRNYSPAGYNPTHAAWEVNAVGNVVDATLTPAAGRSLDHPLLIINGYSLDQLPASLSVGPGLNRPGVDYFASLDALNDRLWVTVNRVAATPVRLQLAPSVVGGDVTLTLEPDVAGVGLRIVAGPNQYDRQNIATVNTTYDYGWIGGGATPVEYALTFAEFPASAFSGFQSHVFLVPNASGSTAPDYEDPSVVMLDLRRNPDGTGLAALRYKINQPADNAFLYGAGTLGYVSSASGTQGTWTLRFVNNTSITVISPAGNSQAFSFPDGPVAVNAFGGNVTAYFGNQANAPGQVGQATVFGRIQISGTPRAPPVDEMFPGPGLNDHPQPVTWQWVVRAVDPNQISIPVAADGLVLSWTLPDTGFVLQFTPGLAPSDWHNLNLPNVTSDGTRKTARVSRQTLPNPNRGFFRMFRPN
ncbi:MAG: hypothetical protein KA004_19305 [Verrucomicrobiales bacterium]|nr:hypothetical protein [Verrucomicrobiales bacterium]